jgi:hypothetical protein
LNYFVIPSDSAVHVPGGVNALENPPARFLEKRVCDSIIERERPTVGDQAWAFRDGYAQRVRARRAALRVQRHSRRVARQIYWCSRGTTRNREPKGKPKHNPGINLPGFRVWVHLSGHGALESGLTLMAVPVFSSMIVLGVTHAMARFGPCVTSWYRHGPANTVMSANGLAITTPGPRSGFKIHPDGVLEPCAHSGTPGPATVSTMAAHEVRSPISNTSANRFTSAPW